jgi:hypothetical protein
MSRPFRPGFDRLEVRALLAASLLESLTTDRSVYPPGQPVVMTLTQTNAGSQTVNVTFGPSVDGFSVTQDGVEIWRSNLGPQPLYLGLHPLRPGESFTQTATWDGRANEGPALSSMPTGAFEVHSDVPGTNTVAIRIGDGPSQPPSPSPSPSPTSLSVSIATDRATYRTGLPVVVTITETNTGTEAARVDGCGPDRVTISRREVAVWQSPETHTCVSIAPPLQPGQSRQFTMTWSGRFSQHLRTPRTGRFSIQASLDGVSASTSFAVGRGVSRGR